MAKALQLLLDQAKHTTTLLGIYSVCSAHPWVLAAAMQQALADDTPLLIESTSNQVDQFGGYTGMQPADFVAFVHQLADQQGLPRERLILGGDHLGPNAWRKLPAEQAMQHAETLITAYVSAGFSKIHLDTSMSCADDPARLDDKVVAARAARLCQVAEAHVRPGAAAPLYVIGTEVPVPGGASEALDSLEVTSAQAAERTAQIHQQAWQAQGLSAVWERVIALVVQPGVEFDHTKVIAYQSAQAQALSQALKSSDGPLAGRVYEAHSTDYQTPSALAALVQDGFAILKVGPALTFALREALYALSDIAAMLTLEPYAPPLREVVESVMLQQPEHWESYYHGSPSQQALLRHYSYSDRIRYYWPHPAIHAAVEQLVAQLSHVGVPENLLSHYLPVQYWAMREGQIDGSPQSIIQHKIREVLGQYAAACRQG